MFVAAFGRKSLLQRIRIRRNARLLYVRCAKLCVTDKQRRICEKNVYVRDTTVREEGYVQCPRNISQRGAGTFRGIGHNIYTRCNRFFSLHDAYPNKSDFTLIVTAMNDNYFQILIVSVARDVRNIYGMPQWNIGIHAESERNEP